MNRRKPLSGDQVMSLNRLAAGLATLVAFAALGDRNLFHSWSIPILAWLALAGCICWNVFGKNRHPGPTRGLSIVLDTAGATLIVGSGGSATAYAYITYLWVITGYGFRFGARWMLVASLLSILGFGYVCFDDEFWSMHTSLSLGLLSALAILPAYSFILIRSLDQARAEAERANAAKSLFLACVSHELRTPLHAIIGMIEGLQGTKLTSEQRMMAGTVNAAAMGQLSLVQDLLEYSRLDAGDSRSETGPIDLCALLDDVVVTVDATSRDKNLRISYHVTARTPLSLEGDKRRIREVLLNLCSNAVKFTSSGSITIAADMQETYGNGILLRFEVTDTGIGIDEKDQGRIFDLFTQASDGTKQQGGTGLGLALCRQQIVRMKGTLGVESKRGEGSTFWFTVPLAVGAQEVVGVEAGAPAIATVSHGPEWMDGLVGRLNRNRAAGPSQPRMALVGDADLAALPAGWGAIFASTDDQAGLPRREVRERCVTALGTQPTPDEVECALRIAAAWAGHQRGRGKAPDPVGPEVISGLVGKTILVADDNRINRSILQRMLGKAGVDVMTAQNGEEALEILLAGGVDAALLDVQMPGMNGIEAAQFYAFSGPPEGRVPLLALTADGTPETRANCIRAGFRQCLLKPIRSADLLPILAGEISKGMVPVPAPVPAKVEAAPTLDEGTVRSLEALVGAAGLVELFSDFEKDGKGLIGRMGHALRDDDLQRFRTEAHALGSIAGNMGAKALAVLCMAWSRIPEKDFAAATATAPAKLRQEWEQACAAIAGRTAAVEVWRDAV